MKIEKKPPHDKREQYEDALFALLMEDFARQEGQRLEELEQKGLPPLPEGLQQRLEKQIDRQWRLRGKRRHRLRRGVSKAAIVLLLLMAGFTALYTNVDAFRDKMRQLVMEYTDGWLQFSTVENGESEQVEDLAGLYVPDFIPEGYQMASVHRGARQYHLEYENKAGNFIRFSCYDDRSTLGIDSKNADIIEDVEIDGNTGLLVDKNNRIEIVWHNKNIGNFYTIYGDKLDRDEAIKMARSVKHEN